MRSLPGGSRLAATAATEEPAGLASRLAREFGAPVGLIDPVRRTWLARCGAEVEDFPGGGGPLPASCPLDAGRVAIWRPGDAEGSVWLVLPVPRALGGDLVALAGFAPGPGPSSGPWGPPCPDRALLIWGRAVLGCLRNEAEVQGLPRPRRELPPASLADRLLRRLRVSDPPPERFQRLAVEEVRKALQVALAAWVPAHRSEPVVVSGGIDGLSPEAFRPLRPEPGAETTWINPSADAPRSDQLRRYAVVADDAEAPAGWLLIANPIDDRPLEAAAIGLLTSVAALLGAQRANARLYADLKDLLFGVIRALTAAIDAKDPYTSGHSERVARIAVRLGEELGLSHNQRGDLYLMGLLHDVGKIGIDDQVLKKPCGLTDEEYRQIQAHVQIGVHILSDLKKLHYLLPGVAHHHENYDGSGYPDGLAGEQIPLPARILAVADAFDAMSSNRPYRRRMSPAQIDEIFRQRAGIQWDARVVEALFACRADLDCIRQKGLGESLHQAVHGTLGRG
ncbi:MAG: HD domain-containing protein [Isosphaeraceae bacterium]|nr:HD domain-containing protein [Isosphaeraceae bacterium]